jgi:hypothetical protein
VGQPRAGSYQYCQAIPTIPCGIVGMFLQSVRGRVAAKARIKVTVGGEGEYRCERASHMGVVGERPGGN